MAEIEIEEGDDAGPIEGAWGNEEYIQDDSTLEVGSNMRGACVMSWHAVRQKRSAALGQQVER